VQDTGIEDENLAKIAREIDAEEKKKTGCTHTLSDTKNAGDYFSLDSDNNLQQKFMSNMHFTAES
jgi:hypothetical protein